MALLSSTVLPAASADPLPPELDVVQQVLDRTVDYATSFDPSENFTTQYQKSQSFIGSLQNILSQVLCATFTAKTYGVRINAFDPTRNQYDIEVIGAGYDNGYAGLGTWHIQNAGAGVHCVPVPIQVPHPIKYNSTLIDSALHAAGLK
ncbi:MAG: hypothetical protein LC623_09740 [Halobacteriales archaeon]|nr:hypothetical protein [Halobacteriales archaeon]